MSGQELVRIRLRLGYTQEQLGDAIGKSRETVNRWERGKRPIPESCAKLIRILATVTKPFLPPSRTGE